MEEEAKTYGRHPIPKQYAKIWKVCFHLGLNKATIKLYLGLNNYQMQYIWRQPARVLTILHIRVLAGLLAPRFKPSEIARLLVRDDYRANTELHNEYIDLMRVLITEDGLKAWDDYKKRSKAGRNGPGRPKKNKLLRNIEARPVYVALNEAIKLGPIEVNNFIAGYDRSKESVIINSKEIVKPIEGPTQQI